MSENQSNPSAALVDKLGAEVVADDEQPTLRLPGRVSPVALELPEHLSFAEWGATVETLLSMVRSVSFWLGDALAYGEAHFGEGDRYAQAIEMTGLEYGTLANITSVCRRVPISRRRESLSFSHHAAVASLDPDDQDRMLDRAEDHGWTRGELRGAVRRLNAGILEEPCRCPRCGQTVPCDDIRDANKPAEAGLSPTPQPNARRKSPRS